MNTKLFSTFQKLNCGMRVTQRLVVENIMLNLATISAMITDLKRHSISSKSKSDVFWEFLFLLSSFECSIFVLL